MNRHMASKVLDYISCVLARDNLTMHKSPTRMRCAVNVTQIIFNIAFQSCVSSLSALARTFLEKSLDWEKNDLNEITRHTFAWEGTLLGLTDEEIHDIKTKHPENYKLQWYG